MHGCVCSRWARPGVGREMSEQGHQLQGTGGGWFRHGGGSEPESRALTSPPWHFPFPQVK